MNGAFDTLGQATSQWRGVVRRNTAAVLSAASALSIVVALALMPPPLGPAQFFLLLAVIATASGFALTVAARQQSRPSTDEDRRYNGLESLGSRIEERLEILQDLRWQVSEREAHYRELLDAQADIIARLDARFSLTFVNRAFCVTFAVAPTDVLGREFDLPTIDDENGGKVRNFPLRALLNPPRRKDAENPEASSETTHVVETTNGQRAIEWTWHPLESAEAEKPAYEIIGRDVTAELAHRRHLAEAREKADLANRCKSRFLASMSHEIRTPMNGILGMAGLLEGTELNSEQFTYVSAISQSATTLLGLIDEILDFSKIEAGKLVLASDVFDLHACLRETVELVAPGADAKGIELAWRTAPGVPRHALGDRFRVRQILLNLLSNAIKATSHGGVSVVISREDATGSATSSGEGQSDTLRLRISVSDTGVGLDAVDQARLFEEFEQPGTNPGSGQGGTGLGLAISLRLARAMNGGIEVESRRGEGSTFTVDLVLQPADAPAEESRSVQQEPASRSAAAAGETEPDTPVRTAQPARRVLLGSDRKIERRINADTLRDLGADVVAVGIGECVEAVKAAGQSGFDCVVVDKEAPDAVALAIIDEARAANSQVEGVILGCSGERDFSQQPRNGGYSHFLKRPVRPGALERFVLGRAGGGEPGVSSPDSLQASSPKAATAPSGRGGKGEPAPASLGNGSRSGTDGYGATGSTPSKILIVEDNAINELVAVKIVESAGYEALVARNGKAAVEHMRRALAGAARMPDAILMDIFMPDIDGVEAARQIRELFENAEGGPVFQGQVPAEAPPIIALTAHAFAEDRERYLRDGLDDCLTKPFVPAELHAILDSAIRTSCERRRGSAA